MTLSNSKLQSVTVMNYDSKNDGLVSLLDLANSLGIVGLRKTIGKDDFPPIEWVSLDKFYIDEKYQRLLNEAMIRNAGYFNPVLCRPILVYKRPDGKYAIVDGQHSSCIAAIYVDDNGKAEILAQILEHDPNATVEECIEEESKLFKKLNILRTNVSQVAQLRADIAAGVKEALEIEETLFDLGVNIEKIGDSNGLSVKGYAKLMESVDTYGMDCTSKAIAYYNSLLHSKVAPKWVGSTLNGAMVGGFAAVYYLLGFLNKGTQKYSGLVDFLDGQIIGKVTTPKELMNKTSGNTQFVLIARRFVDYHKTAILMGNIVGQTIGEGTLSKAGLGDPSTVSKRKNEDELDED